MIRAEVQGSDQSRVRAPCLRLPHILIRKVHWPMKLSSVAVVAAAVVLAVATAAPASASSLPHPGSMSGSVSHHPGLIVAEEFSAANGGNPYIYSIRPDGTHKKVLTTGYVDTDPELSPDGRQIVFLRCTQLSSCGDIGTTNAWLMRSDGTHARQLTHCDGTDCLGSGNATFSPDGRWVAFGLDQLDAHGVNYEGIFLERTDGTHLTRVTINGRDNPPDEDPQFSPDGRSLVFDREDADGAQAIVTVRVDGSHLRVLNPTINGFSPDWSPRGDRLTFTLVHGSGSAAVFDIATMRTDGSRVRVLTSAAPGTGAFLSSYSPDGRRLVYTQANPNQGGDLTIIPASGGTPRTIATSSNTDAGAEWGVLAHG
jgi:Tol biopolymer transport system component